jgi:hypothetical protein
MVYTGVVADSGVFGVGTRDLREQTASGECNGLPITVVILVKAWRESGSTSL